jgi:murein tripeptide amidase MpaA
MRRDVLGPCGLGPALVVSLLSGLAAGPALGAPDGDPVASPAPRYSPNALPYVGCRLVHVTPGSAASMLAVQTLSETVLDCTPSPDGIDAVISAAKWDAFVALNLPHRVVVEDVAADITREMDEIDRLGAQRDTAWFQTFRRLSEIDAKLTEYAGAFPTLVTSFNIGNSLQNRPINGIRITGPDAPTNPRSTRPQLVFNGGQHAREWINPMTVMFIANQLLDGYATDARIRAVLDNAEVDIIPVMNPDGFEYTWNSNRNWRKNRRPNANGSFGVDNNRNWGYQWGGEGASSSQNNDTYRGTGPFSEPETQRVRDFLINNPRTEVHIDYHSYAKLILSPWAYTSQLPPDAAFFNTMNAGLRSTINAVHGQNYNAGPTYTIIYPASGASMDYAYGALGIAAWGIELRGTSFAPPSTEIIPCGEENVAGILFLGEWALNQLLFTFPSGRPTSVAPAQPVSINIDIANNSGNLVGDSGKVLYRHGGSGPFSAVSLGELGGTHFRAVIPAAEGCNVTTEYYFEATADQTGRVMRSPLGAPTALYSYINNNGVCCRADFNGDGQADFFDYLDFAQAFATEDPSADFNGDSQVDFFDYLDFVDALGQGC